MDAEMLSRTVFVRSIPAKFEREILEVSLENRRYNGGDIDDIQLNTDEGTALVTFTDAEVATRLVAIGHVDIDGHRLLIVAPPVAEPPCCTVYVYDVPTKLCDCLRDFMESKRNGGGQIDRFEYDEEHHAATITFHQSEIAEKFIASESIQLMKRTLIVSSSAPGSSNKSVTVADGSQSYCNSASCVGNDLQDSPEVENDSIIYVHDVPEDLKEIVYSYLENHRHGGGDIVDFQFDDDGSFARFTFVDVNVAKHFKEQKELNIDGIDQTMYVSDSPPPVGNTAAVDIDTSSFDVQSVTSDPDSDAASKTVFIENVPDDMLQFLEPVLESKKAGGGPIECFEEQDGGALVTFQDVEVAQQLLAAGQVVFGSTVLKVVAPPAENNAVLVSGIPRTMPRDMLIAFLENSRVGGDVLDVDYTDGKESAMVRFQDPQVAKRLLDAGCIQNKKSILHISPVTADNSKMVATDVADTPAAAAAATAASDDGDSDSYEDAPTEPEIIDTIEVRNIPEKLKSRDTLMMFFENKRRSGGGEITNVVMTADSSTAFITFKDPNITQSLIAKQELNYGEHIIHIRKPVTQQQQQQQQQQQPSADSPADVDDTNLTIQIIGIPTNVKRETLLMYLENTRKSGGGTVSEYDYNEGSGKATVSFQDSHIAAEMLSKGKLTYLGGQVLTVVKPKPLQHSASAKSIDDSESIHIQILGIPTDVKSQTLMMYLENKRKSGGGDIDQLEYREGSGTATVSFRDNHIAEEMLRKGQLTYLGGQTLTVVKPRLIPRSQSAVSDAGSNRPNTDDQWSPTPVGQRASPRTIQVTGLTKEIKKDQLGLYFENRRSCGGPVHDIQLLDDCAFVTFAKADDALRVAKKTDHVLSKASLSIELLDTWPETTSCAIKVQGFNPSTTDDAIDMYFESARRTGGDTIEEMFYDADKRVAVITYKSRDVAGRVAKRSDLTLNGAALTVEWLKPGRPPPVCLDVQNSSPDTLLFTELPTNIEPDVLKKFASHAAGISVSNVTFSPRPGVALVTFQGSPDYERVRLAVCSRPCHGKMVSVQRLQQSTAIQVHNIGTVGLKNIELYFENKRSGGGTIKRIESGAGYFILEFEDKQVKNQVLSKTHLVSGQKLQVQPYFPGFGVLPPGFDSSRPLQPLPPDVEVACAPEVAGFIAANKQLKHKIEELMKSNGCFINWPRFRTDKLVLHCNINPQQPGAYAQLQNWSERCTEIIQKELKPIIFIKEEILQEIWKQLRDKVEAGAQCNPQEILVHWEDADCVVYACGIRNHVQNFQKFVQQMKNGLEDDLAKSKKRITENVTLKPHQTYLLRTIDLSALSSNKDIKVSFSDTGVTLIGQSADVRLIKLELLQKVSGMTSSSLDSVSSGQLKLLNRAEYKAHIHRIFQQKKLPITFDVQSGEVMVHGFESRDVDDAVELIKSEVSEKSIPLKGKCVAFVGSKTWNDFLSELSKQFKVVDITVSENSINITATSVSEAQAIGVKIQEFLDKTVIIEEFISISPGAAKVLKNYADHQVDRLQQSIKKYRGEVKLETSSRYGCVLKINLGGVLKAKQEIAALVQNVRKKDHNILPNFVQFLLTDKSRMQVQFIASKNKVVIHYPEDEVKSIAAASHMSFDPYVFSEMTTTRGKLIRLVVGDIVKYPADVVVNAANSRLEHGSGVAGAIAKLGGPVLIAECREYVKQHGQLHPGQVFKSSSGGLSFKAVIHTVGPIWRQGNNNEDHELMLAVESALKESDKLKYKSVSLPAISCGIYAFPIEQGTEIILRNVIRFLERCTSVNEVYIVSGRNIILKFQETLVEMVGSDKIKIEDKRSSNDAGEESDDDNNEADDASCSDNEYDKVSDVTEGPYHPAQTSFRTAQGLTVTLIKGSIVSVKADAIFNTTEKDLDLSKGIVSKNILAQAGSGLQDECRTKYPQGVSIGQVIKTTAHKLPFKWIYHGVPRRWDNGTGDSEKVMRMLVKSTLNFSATDKLTSVAFPAIGTGNLRIPHNIVARAMFDEVISFSAANESRISLRDVYFVLYDRDQLTIDAFESELQRLRNGATGPSYMLDASNRPAAKQNVQKLDCFIGDIKFQVKSGDITKERCDAIVNSTNDKLDLRFGVLSKAIVSAGGESIVDECKQQGGASKGWAVTGAGRLPCKYIIHLVAKKDIKSWKAVINTCFKEADKMQVKSLAMPPLGAGRSGAGEGKEIAEAILEEVAIFANSKPQYLKDIIVTVQQPGMVEQFVSAAENVDKLDKHNPLWKLWEKVKGITDRAVTHFSAPSTGSKEHDAPKRKRYLKPGAQRHVTDSKLVLSIYGLSMPSIDDAIREVDNICKESKKSFVLKNDDVQKAVGKLTPDEEGTILALKEQYNVSINIVKPSAAGNVNGAQIVVEGDNENIGMVVQEIYGILLKVKDREKLERELELLADQAVWEYADGLVYKVYDIQGRGILEKAHREKKTSVEWTDSAGKHAVSLSNLEDSYIGKKMAIRRSLPGTMALPSDWSPVPQGQSHIAVNLAATSQEFLTVKNDLMSTANNMVKNVLKVERIQNPFLYRQYMAKKEELDQRYGTGSQNELRLWHGTAGNNIINISKNNFNRSYGGQHGLAYGAGVYFAVGSAYSISGYSRADATGTKHIYRARVLVGKSTPGQSGLKEPPAGFDSVTDPGKTMYIVFYDAQTYPEYLITFQ